VYLQATKDHPNRTQSLLGRARVLALYSNRCAEAKAIYAMINSFCRPWHGEAPWCAEADGFVCAHEGTGSLPGGGGEGGGVAQPAFASIGRLGIGLIIGGIVLVMAVAYWYRQRGPRAAGSSRGPLYVRVMG